MKKLIALLLMMILVVSLTGCNKFSYAEEYRKYVKYSDGVKHGGFVNTSDAKIVTDTDALERAKKECTVKWDSSKVYFDDELKIWKVVFYKKEKLGGDQSIYMNEDGKTILIVNGE